MARAWPLIRLLPTKTDFRFVRYAGAFGLVSLLLVAGSFASFFTAGFTKSPAAILANAGPTFGDKAQAMFCAGFNCGIDFRGGSAIVVTTEGPPPLAELRAALSGGAIGDVQVQGLGAEDAATLRFETPDGMTETQAADEVRRLLAAANIPGLGIGAQESVGPKVSGELLTGGVTALGLAIVLMLVYIWFRFELNYGVGAVVALFHDVILTMGLMSVLRLDFSLTSIAALLTVIGYSMNDTVVVFDRMRENRRKFKKMPWAELMDVSINETFSRTVVTGGTGLLALTALLVFGGASLSSFVIAMIFGIIVGTYSSIYVASPVLLLRRDSKPEAAKAEPDAAGA